MQKLNIPAKCPGGIHPDDKNFSGEVSSRRFYQRGSLVKGSASPVILKRYHLNVFPLRPGGKCSKSVPGEKFEIHRVTWPGYK